MGIREKVEKIVPALDKLKHIFLGVLLLVPSSKGLKALNLFVELPSFTWWGEQMYLIPIGFLVGYGIEFWQKFTNSGVYDDKDALATAVAFIACSLTHINF